MNEHTIDFLGIMDIVTTYAAKYGPTALAIIIILLFIFIIILFWSENK